VIAVDMPGHGDSDPLPGTPALPDYVAWAARVVQALGLGPVSVAGHSMGALIAAWAWRCTDPTWWPARRC
jgi:pimeloyl-ACP methyl ester carboxylesterase